MMKVRRLGNLSTVFTWQFSQPCNKHSTLRCIASTFVSFDSTSDNRIGPNSPLRHSLPPAKFFASLPALARMRRIPFAHFLSKIRILTRFARPKRDSVYAQTLWFSHNYDRSTDLKESP